MYRLNTRITQCPDAYIFKMQSLSVMWYFWGYYLGVHCHVARVSATHLKIDHMYMGSSGARCSENCRNFTRILGTGIVVPVNPTGWHAPIFVITTQNSCSFSINSLYISSWYLSPRKSKVTFDIHNQLEPTELMFAIIAHSIQCIIES